MKQVCSLTFMAFGLAVFPSVYWESTGKLLMAAITYSVVVSIAGGSPPHVQFTEFLNSTFNRHYHSKY